MIVLGANASGAKGAPSAPTIGTATAGNGSASVTFTAPSFSKLPVTSYTVTASPGGATGTGASSPVTVSGLTNGTSYTFTVTASTSNSTSTSSASSNSVSPVAPVPGTSFSLGTLPVSATSSYRMIGAGPYIFLVSNSSATYYTTTNGSTWTSRTFATSSGFDSISYYNGVYVAAGGYTSWASGNAPYYTSTDLNSWTARTLNDGGNGFNYQYVISDGTRHVMVTTHPSTISNGFYTSTDGVNWNIYTSVAVNTYSGSYRVYGPPYYINGYWVIGFADSNTWTPVGVSFTNNLAGSWTRYNHSPSNAYLYNSEVQVKSDFSIGWQTGNGGSSGQYRYFTVPNSYTYSSAIGASGWSNCKPVFPGQGNIFFVKNGNTWYRSTNGTSWTSYSDSNVGTYLSSGSWACSPTSGIITSWSWPTSQTNYIYSVG